MHKLAAKAFTHFIKDKSKRKYVLNILTNKLPVPDAHKYTGGYKKKAYEIAGLNNKIIIIDNGIERELKKNESISGLDVQIRGNGNTIKIELPFKAYDSKIDIIDNNNAYIELRKCPRLGNVYIRCNWASGQRFLMRQNTTIIGAQFLLDGNSSITIGEDCMFSNNIFVWADDGHAVLDAETGDILNKPSGALTIGNHCWIGQGVRLTKNARIGNNCILAGGTVAVKDYAEDNVVIGGNPGKIIKRGITWDRRNPYHLEKDRQSQPAPLSAQKNIA